MKLFYSSKIVQQEVTRRQQRKFTELPIVFHVVCNKHLTIACHCTLILKHVLKILAGLIYCITQLLSVHRKDFYALLEMTKDVQNFFPCTSLLYDIGHICKCQCRSIQNDFTFSSNIEDILCQVRPLSIINIIDKDIRINKNLLHLLRIYASRSSAAISSGVNDTQPRNFRNDSESPFPISFSALAKKTSSALRLVSSASRMDSCKYSITACITSISAPFVISNMGAIDDDWIVLTVAVITSFF